jgi:hypothetical protein
VSKGLNDLMLMWMAPWCKCICRVAPDGTMCKLCGHAHENVPDTLVIAADQLAAASREGSER